MGINTNNYEAFFLDYYENRLQPEQTAELLVFLEAHPELKEEFESFEMITLPDEPVLFYSKNQLKKKELRPTSNISSLNYEQWLVAELENDLSATETDELKQFISNNPAVKLELNLLKKTKLLPGNILFEDKRSLKRGGLLLIFQHEIYKALAIAALLLLFIGIYFGDDRIQSTSRQITKIELNYKAPAINIENIPFDFATVVAPSQRNKYAETGKSEIIVQKTEEINRPSMRNKNIQIEIAANAVDLNFEIPDFFDLPAKNKSVDLANNETKKSFLSRFVSGFASKLIEVDKSERKSFLEYTVSGYNMIADREVEVEKEYSSSGQISAYNVKGETISFSRKVNPRSAE